MELEKPCKESDHGYKQPNGYYQFSGRVGGERQVTRYIYKKFIGPLEKDEEIRHICNNRGCIEITHLTKGSHKDNMHDQIRTGNFNRQKLTIDQVKEIRKEYRRGKKTMAEIGKEYGVKANQISRIINYERWSNEY
jgi:S-adenosylmethionine synthetase